MVQECDCTDISEVDDEGAEVERGSNPALRSNSCFLPLVTKSNKQRPRMLAQVGPWHPNSRLLQRPRPVSRLAYLDIAIHWGERVGIGRDGLARCHQDSGLGDQDSVLSSAIVRVTSRRDRYLAPRGKSHSYV
jgi:hypothetical protein